MEGINAYYLVIGAAAIIILSYLYNILAQKTNIPSVILLIVTGYVTKEALGIEFNEDEWFLPLEVLGIVGLILIVLEAALDLELKKEKIRLIWQSSLVAGLSLFFNTFFLAFGIQFFIGNLDLLTAVIYAIPLSITSSAIVIPSVNGLEKDKREFLIYESTISDILGIMFFYLLVENLDTNGATMVGLNVLSNIGGTLLLSVTLSYAMILAFQRIKSDVKLFLFFAVLILFYALGKLFHLSSLLMILVFGMILENRLLFFSGFLRKYLYEENIKRVLIDFKLLTRESSFVVRTFFFFILGMSMTLAGVFVPKILLLTLYFLVGLFAFRWLIFKLIFKRNYFPQFFVAPRGLISILLFFAIPKEFRINDFELGILLLSIVVTSLLMAWALVFDSFGKVGRMKRFISFKKAVHRGKNLMHRKKTNDKA
ncbi:cation:proton antiporter [Carboxylicivirga sp. M1479]|uniref:cation:proton antiporter domain-containing protein n=1 Tax=Carboxylicivirga sp. M1479 TaxID=2594476 RepID=UPI0011775A65|nr:cation:proton antiporter [Carboxylicivirga sp. M1479]TRX65873.1 sodium:proton exchanger [Carboxylicivirga sp. M1479]